MVGCGARAVVGAHITRVAAGDPTVSACDGAMHATNSAKAVLICFSRSLDGR